MITTNGQAVIRKFFTGEVREIASTMALGTGTTAVNVNNTALATPVATVPLDSINGDIVDNRIIFKARIPVGLIPTIAEVGIMTEDGTLVARTVLGTAVTTDAEIPSEVEYALEIAFS